MEGRPVTNLTSDYSKSSITKKWRRETTEKKEEPKKRGKTVTNGSAPHSKHRLTAFFLLSRKGPVEAELPWALGGKKWMTGLNVWGAERGEQGNEDISYLRRGFTLGTTNDHGLVDRPGTGLLAGLTPSYFSSWEQEHQATGTGQSGQGKKPVRKPEAKGTKKEESES